MTDKIPGRMAVQQCGQHQVWLFRCDDRNGFMFKIVLAGDGDLHLSIVEDPDHEDVLSNCNYLSGSVRLRMPMIGGGMYEHLHVAIKKAMVQELAKEQKRYPGAVHLAISEKP